MCTIGKIIHLFHTIEIVKCDSLAIWIAKITWFMVSIGAQVSIGTRIVVLFSTMVRTFITIHQLCSTNLDAVKKGKILGKYRPCMNILINSSINSEPPKRKHSFLVSFQMRQKMSIFIWWFSTFWSIHLLVGPNGSHFTVPTCTLYEFA